MIMEMGSCSQRGFLCALQNKSLILAGANTTDHIYVSENKLCVRLHLLSHLDSYSYELPQYPVWALLIHIQVYICDFSGEKENT